MYQTKEKSLETAQLPGTKKAKISFFMGIALLGFFAVFVGFGKTLPPVMKDTRTPTIIFIHGAFAFGWLCMFFVQATLIRFNNFALHRLLGVVGIFVALGAAVTMVPAGVYEVQRKLESGQGEVSYSFIVGTIASATMFLVIVTAAILNRRNPPVHKRLMLLATILILWVAWFRFRHYFPSVSRPDIWFGLVLPYSLIVISWVWDKYVNGRLHPVLGWVGALIIAEQSFEVIMFDSPAWRSFGKELFGLFS